MSAPAPSAPATPAQVRSEDVLSAKTDLCLSNALVKAGTGLAVGIVASAILFRRRPWPVFLGLGFGFGQGYSDCERVFNPAAVPGFKVAGVKEASPFKLSTPFTSVVSPSQTSAVPPSPAAPAPSSSSPAPAAATIKAKVADAVSEAKAKASDLAGQAQTKASEVKKDLGAKTAEAEKKVDGAVDAVKGDKKWV
ncbi:Mic10p [Rhodotorula paludigena]|uniref:Mic10p n=1 Tax=Rhodotorula paludigena TaxID=86838 RepID=UPI003178A979